MGRSTVQAGRAAARLDGDFVVFVIGMRFNKLWKVHRWLPVFVAMPRMLKVLKTDPDKGFLGGCTMLGGRTVTMIQYWRSFDQLEHFARSADDPHLQAWRDFNRRIGASGDVGVFHETYRISPGAYECLYSNTPRMGLAAAGERVAITPRSEAARQRLENFT